MLNISQISKKYIWRSTSFKKIATLHTVTSLTVNSITDIFLQILQSFQNSCLKTFLPMSKSEFIFKLMSRVILHYSWSGDISKSFSQLIMSIFIFSQYVFNRFSIEFFSIEKSGQLPHIAYIVIH